MARRRTRSNPRRRRSLGALFISNPRRRKNTRSRRRNPVRRRRNGLALRENSSKNTLVMRELGISRAATRELKRTNYKAYNAAFQRAGGARVLAASKLRSKATRARVKMAGGKKGPAWIATLRGGSAAAERQMGVRATKKDKRGRTMYYIDGKRVRKAVYDAVANPRRRRRNPSRRRNPIRRRRNTARRPSYGALALRTNPNGILRQAADLVAKVPLAGPVVAPYVAPLVSGAGAGAVMFFVGRELGPRMPERAQPFAYTLSGAAGALALEPKFMPGTKGQRRMIGGLLVLTGACLDTYRWYMERAEGAQLDVAVDESSAVAGFGALALQQNPGYGAWAYEGGALNGLGAVESDLMMEYNDASPGDAYYSGEDFSDVEGSTILAGPRYMFRRFGRPAKRARRARGPYSRHAGRMGHRWAWLIKLVGFKGAQKIAALPPHQRVAVIAKLRNQAMASLPALMAAQSSGPLPAALAAANGAHAAMTPGSLTGESAEVGQHGYGAYVYEGGAL